jgi:hypothetical protein
VSCCWVFDLVRYPGGQTDSAETLMVSRQQQQAQVEPANIVWGDSTPRHA